VPRELMTVAQYTKMTPSDAQLLRDIAAKQGVSCATVIRRGICLAGREVDVHKPTTLGKLLDFAGIK